MRPLGSRIVVCTGAFQYLHFAHRFILQEARKLGRVIVLLNGDEAILSTKGYLAEDFETRKANILATELVEEVIKIETDPTEELKRIRPDYQIMGGDHTIEEALSKGGNYVGEIVVIERIPNISSSVIYKELNGKSCNEDVP